VSESKKVTSFLRGVQDPKLDSGKVNVYGDAAKLDDFQATQQYLKTLVETMTQQEKMERNVSSATRGGGGGKSLVDKIKGGSYSKEQFESLTKEEKERVAQYREEAQKKKNSRARERAKKRKLAKAQSVRNDDANTGDGEDEPAGANAGAQFGSNGNKSKKKSK
jgi:hypothetical protein